MEKEQIVSQLIVELRRGTQMIVVLHALKEQSYGYKLLQKLNDLHVNIEAGTLYPLLRRLEKQGLLESIWDTTESRPRKFYILSSLGSEVLSILKDEWMKINQELSLIYEEKR